MSEKVELHGGAVHLRELLAAEDLERFLSAVRIGFFSGGGHGGSQDYESAQVHTALLELAGKEPEAGHPEAIQGMIIQALGKVPNLMPERNYGLRHPQYREDRRQTTNLVYLAALLDRDKDLFEALFSLIPDSNMMAEYGGVPIVTNLKGALMSIQGTDERLVRTWQDMVDQVDEPSDGSVYSPIEGVPGTLPGSFYTGFDGLVNVLGSVGEDGDERMHKGHVAYAMVGMAESIDGLRGESELPNPAHESWGRRVDRLGTTFGYDALVEVLEQVVASGDGNRELPAWAAESAGRMLELHHH